MNGECPQGSALGPLLWNIFQNDLTYEMKSDVSMYGDNHQLCEMGEDLAKVKSSLAGNAEKASRWYEVNLLKRNISKYKTMLMYNDYKVTTSLSLNIQRNEMELTDKLLLLGVSIDCYLNFSDHIKTITKKTSQRIGVLIRLKKPYTYSREATTVQSGHTSSSSPLPFLLALL